MADYRGLLTDREREVLGGEVDVSRNYVYQVRSRVRGKIDRLGEDAAVLEAHHPELHAELRAAVCEDERN